MASAAALLAAVLVVTVVFGSLHYVKIKRCNDYIAALKGLDIYENSLDDALPQTIIRDTVYNHFFANESGKTPKLLFIGYDGCQAVMPSLNYGKSDSAITKVASTGGLYLTYAGGAQAGDQATSTAPGWASIFTGVWATQHGVKDNNNTLNESTRSIIFQLAAQDKAVSYSVIWDTHITGTYKLEVAAADKNNYPAQYNLGKTDSDTYASMLAGIQAGEAGIFGILEYPDHAGHTSGFALSNNKYKAAYYDSEKDANNLIAAAKARETYDQEDWLIIITSDHGGYRLGHGGTTPMEKYTFLAINKPLA